MNNQNKIILILLAIILILGTILCLKISQSDSTPEVSNDIKNTTSIEENKNNDEKLNNINLNSINTSSNMYINLVINILDLIVIMIIVPILLRRYNILSCVIIVVMYRLIIGFLTGGNLFVLGIIPALLVIGFNFVYYYILFWIINKLLLDANPIVYFLSVSFLEFIIYLTSGALIGSIISNLIL